MSRFNSPISGRQRAARFIVAVSAVLAAVPSAAFDADAPGGNPDELLDMSLEELLDVEITSVSKRSQSLSTAPAAVFVISQQDMRRSGAQTIPDALRMVPGMNVAQIDGNKWAVTARGFNGRYAAKLLVLIDGRSIYTPLFSGVWWDVQDISLDSIERIEVIRGPGATLWGANAVNGIINIITKSAAETHGGLASVGVGTEGGNEVAMRYGAAFNEQTHYRVFAKYHDRMGNSDLSGNPTADDWQSARLGLRVDRETGSGDSMMFVSEVYEGTMGSTVNDLSLQPPFLSIVDAEEEASGFYAQFAWNRILDSGSEMGLQVYYDHTDRDAYLYDSVTVDTIDLDFQYAFSLRDRHEIVWGLNYRYSDDQMVNGFSLALQPTSDSQRWTSFFIQDEYAVSPDRAYLTVGAKFEHHSFSQEDVEIQPNVRFRYHFGDSSTVWGSVSRAVRLPARGDRGAQVVSAIIPPLTPMNPAPVPVSVNLYGNPAYESEELVAYELGYRTSPSENLIFDVAAFFHQHDNERSIATGAPMCMPSGVLTFIDPLCVISAQYIETPLSIANSSGYESYGVELLADWTPTTWWRLQGVLSTLRRGEDEQQTPSPVPVAIVQESPEFQASVRSMMNFSQNTEFDLWLRYVDELPESGVDSYVTADLRIAWSPRDTLQIAVVGKNLFDPGHIEFISEVGDVVPVEIERRASVEFRWSF